jgi:hypothetical protein
MASRSGSQGALATDDWQRRGSLLSLDPQARTECPGRSGEVHWGAAHQAPEGNPPHGRYLANLALASRLGSVWGAAALHGHRGDDLGTRGERETA